MLNYIIKYRDNLAFFNLVWEIKFQRDTKQQATVLYILMFMFSDSRKEEKNLGTEW
jgi:hypothetical protein